MIIEENVLGLLQNVESSMEGRVYFLFKFAGKLDFRCYSLGQRQLQER